MDLLFLTAAIASTLFPSGDRSAVEPGGARIELREGRAVRVVDSTTVELPCTSANGTGEIRALASDPAGLTYFAAENGLFVVGPFIDHLDPVLRREGAPSGEPRSVYVDRERRVWLATDESVGVVEPSFGWGRTLETGDLVAASGDALAPPFHFEPKGEGLLVVGQNGEASYQPDQAPRPTVDRLEINGAPVLADAIVDAGYGESQRLSAEGTAAGGATFRYRVDGHHVWRDLENADSLDRLNPGEHLVEVVACDRDLNLSAPFPVRFRVAMPIYFGKGFVLGVGALVSLIVLGLSLALQRPGTPLLRRVLAGVPTTAVVLIFGVQILAGLIPHAKGWPFVGYSMYSKSFRPEVPVHRPVLIARTPGGVEREIPPQLLGYAIDGRWQVLGPIVTGGDSVERDALQRVRKRVTGPGVDVLQVQSRRFRLTKGGPVPIAPLVLSHYRWKDQ